MGIADAFGLKKEKLSDVGAGRPPQLASTDEALAAVRRLLPGFAERAAVTDRDRCVPRSSISELEQAGLFGILTPRGYGGSALGWQAFFQVVSEIGTVCGSTAWVFGVLTGHNHMVTRFPESVQERVLGKPGQHMSVVFRLSEPWAATPSDGGFVLSGGQGRYCSGVDYAKFVGVNAIVNSGPKAGQLAFFLIETEQLKLLDDWHTIGMRGTQSRSIIVDDVFVPNEMAAFAVDLEGPALGPAAKEGAVFSWPYFAIAPFAIVGAPLGVSRGALATTLKSVKRRVEGWDDELVATMAAVFSRLSHCEQDIESAHDMILKDLRVVDSQHFSEVHPVILARFRRDLAASAQLARYAATRLFEGGGGSAIYSSGTMERMLRDVSAGAAHFAFTDDVAAPNYGRALLGLPPAKSNTFV